MTPFYAQDHDYSQFNVLAVDDIPLNLLLVQKMLAKFNFTLRPPQTASRRSMPSPPRSPT